MAHHAKAKAKKGSNDFVLMANTRALLSRVWDDLQQAVDHAPGAAKSALQSAIDELQSEASGPKVKKALTKVKKLGSSEKVKAKRKMKSAKKSVVVKAKKVKAKVVRKAKKAV